MTIKTIRTSNIFEGPEDNNKKGGFGIVYFARRAKDGKTYALKTIKEWPENPKKKGKVSNPNRPLPPEQLEKLKKHFKNFRDEALVWIALGKHKNIVQAFWFDFDEYYQPYLIMEFVKGHSSSGASLKDRINRDHSIIQEDAITITIEALDGLIHAKRIINKELNKEFVHRDLKPENILLSHEGSVKVTDFGAVLNAAGTYKYMAPEQYGKESAVEEKTDVYALGCVLFEMIEGEPLCNGPNPHDFHMQHLNEVPRKASHANPELAGLISACLRKSPHERPGFSILRMKLESIHIKLTGKVLPPPSDIFSLSPEELNARGVGFDELGYYDNALKCYDEAIEKDPLDFRYYLNKANTLLSLEDYEGAQEGYRRAMVIAPRAVEVYLGQGALMARKKKINEAFACYKKGLEIDNNEPLFYVSLGNLYGQMGCCREAELHFRNALALNPGQAEAHLGLGNVNLLIGNSGEAIKEYKKALRFNPLYDEAYQAIDYIKDQNL
jgi:serine/threonine protein kinase